MAVTAAAREARMEWEAKAAVQVMARVVEAVTLEAKQEEEEEARMGEEAATDPAK